MKRDMDVRRLPEWFCSDGNNAATAPGRLQIKEFLCLRQRLGQTLKLPRLGAYPAFHKLGTVRCGAVQHKQKIKLAR